MDFIPFSSDWTTYLLISPGRGLGRLLRLIIFPWGMRRKRPADKLSQRCAELLLSPSAARDRLTAGIFVTAEPDDPVVGCLEHALDKVLAAEAIERKLIQTDHEGSIKQAVKAGLLSDMEAQQLVEAEKATHKVIMVDDFDPAELSNVAERWKTGTRALAH